jgi:NTP pyrophosphatase (non-canonical NTP hydrolase)
VHGNEGFYIQNHGHGKWLRRPHQPGLHDPPNLHSIEHSVIMRNETPMYKWTDDRNNEDTFKFVVVKASTARDVEVCATAVPFLRSLIKRLMVEPTRGLFDDLEQTILRLCSFLFSVDWEEVSKSWASTGGDPIELFKAQGTLQRSRQTLYREQGAIRALMEVLNMLSLVASVNNIDMEFNMEKQMEKKEQLMRMKAMSNHIPVKISSYPIWERPRMLCHLVYQTLEFCFQDNFENQMYTASWIDMMLSHLGHKLGAEHCLTELVGENVELLHKKAKFQGLIY